MDDISIKDTKPTNTILSGYDITICDKSSSDIDARNLIELLQGEDLSGRVLAASKLEIVAAALGEKRTREELLPFLVDCMDDEDEVLTTIAISLGNLVPFVGGANQLYCLLTPLELLLSVEESSVRENAGRSVITVSNKLPINIFQSQYSDMIIRLAKKEWFTSRLSACSLIASAFSRLSLDQREIHLQHFTNLCRDDIPMVRRIASQYFRVLLSNVVSTTGVSCTGKDGIINTKFMPLYEELADNCQPDSVRLQTTENGVAFGQVMSNLTFNNDMIKLEGRLNKITNDKLVLSMEDFLLNKILPLILSTIDDKSWRVRWITACKFADVVNVFGKIENAMDFLISSYEKLLQDPEAEVRTAAALNLSEVAKCKCKILPSSLVKGKLMDRDSGNCAQLDVVARLMKRFTALTEDDSENVRAALAMIATDLAPILGKEDTITHLVPPVLLLLRDETSEVRLNVISNLESLNEVVGVDILSQSLLQPILDLAGDGKWRIRMATIEHFPLLAKQLGEEFFSNELTSLCVRWLGDDISSIREAAATNIKELAVLFGANWVSIYILPTLLEFHKDQSYLRRLIAVQTFCLLATVVDSGMTRSQLLPIVLKMASDEVPNIRFNVAKGLEKLVSVCGIILCNSQILPVLTILAEDPDQDVRFYANRTLEFICRNEVCE